jgi:hypothetical protein
MPGPVGVARSPVSGVSFVRSLRYQVSDGLLRSTRAGPAFAKDASIQSLHIDSDVLRFLDRGEKSGPGGSMKKGAARREIQLAGF